MWLGEAKKGDLGTRPLTEVRRVQPDEWELLRQTRLSALADAPSAFGTTYAEAVERPESWWRAWAERSATGDAQAMFLAWDGTRPVGIAGVFRDESHCQVISMWTDPQYRGRGIGHVLLDAVVVYAGEGELRSQRNRRERRRLAALHELRVRPDRCHRSAAFQCHAGHA